MSQKAKEKESANGFTRTEMPQPEDTAPDPFDVSRLRMAQVDPTTIGVQEVVTSIPYKRPPKDSFFRVHSSPEYSATVGLVELNGRDETYYVIPELWAALVAEPTFSRRTVFTCVTMQGEVFLWGCRLPGIDGKVPVWVSVPLEAAAAARDSWVKMFWDQSQRKHRFFVAPQQHTEPQWPDKPLGELLRLAFKDSLITDIDHPVLRRLRGEV